MHYWDAHCHLADPRIESTLDSILGRAQAAGFGVFVQGGVGPEDWERQSRLAAKYPAQILPVYGLHPWWVAENGEGCPQAFEKLRDWLPQGVGLGELGLDHGPRCAPESRPLQWVMYKKQLELGRDSGKPLVLHVVKAHAEALDELRRLKPPGGWKGIVHSFTQGPDTARAYVELGLTISVGAAVCRKGFESLKRAVVGVPLEHWVMESDAPDQPGPRFAGGLNEPSAVRDAAEAVAALRGISADEVLARSQKTLEGIFVT
jgi:TatD DNase family protein